MAAIGCNEKRKAMIEAMKVYRDNLQFIVDDVGVTSSFATRLNNIIHHLNDVMIAVEDEHHWMWLK